MVRAKIAGRTFAEHNMIEHTAQGGIAGMNAKADNSPCELVHDDQDPVGFEENRLASEHIDAPKAAPHVADEGEP